MVGQILTAESNAALPAKADPPALMIWAINELQKRKESGNFISVRRDLLGQLMEAHKANPEKFGEGDVFAIAFGAMQVPFSTQDWNRYWWNTQGSRCGLYRLYHAIVLPPCAKLGARPQEACC